MDKKKPTKKETIIKGIPAAPGIVIGKVHIFGAEDLLPRERTITEEDIPQEISRFKQVLVDTRREIIEIEKRISKEIGV